MTIIRDKSMDDIDQIFRKLANEHEADAMDFEVIFSGSRSLGSYRGMLTYLQKWGEVVKVVTWTLHQGNVTYYFRFLVSMDKVKAAR